MDLSIQIQADIEILQKFDQIQTAALVVIGTRLSQTLRLLSNPNHRNPVHIAKVLDNVAWDEWVQQFSIVIQEVRNRKLEHASYWLLKVNEFAAAGVEAPATQKTIANLIVAFATDFYRMSKDPGNFRRHFSSAVSLSFLLADS